MINGVPRILVIRLSAIGDVVRVLPAAHALRDAYPTAQIDWVVEPKSADVVTGHPALDQWIIFERSKGFFANWRALRKVCRQIRQNRYDIVIDFHGVFKTGLMTRASRAPKRFGFSRPRSKEMSWLFTKQRIALPSMRLNRIDENLEICKALDAKRHNLDVLLHVPESVRDRVDDYFDTTFHGGKHIVMIHVPVERPEKQWPLKHFAALADMILADGRFEVVLTWGPGQRPIAEEVQHLSKRKASIAPEAPDLKHFAWMVQRSDIFIGGDTGPMHIASAMGTPVVVLFGGTDPVKHGPMRQPSKIFYTGPDPFPKRMPLERAQQYLKQIDPEHVYDAAVQMIFQKSS